MKHFTLLFLFLLFVLPTIAQQRGTRNFMQHLRGNIAGEGHVVVVQDSLIDYAVNNKTLPTAKSTTKHKVSPSAEKDKNHKTTHKEKETEKNSETTAPATSTEHTVHESEHTATHSVRQRYKAQGYRIQIFTGSNSHADKQKAYDVGRQCQKAFPMLSVYPRFVSPRWICRVGDFRNHEDAQTYARKIRAARIGTEVRIVRCEVLLAH